jgi:hypothetical protein
MSNGEALGWLSVIVGSAISVLSTTTFIIIKFGLS